MPPTPTVSGLAPDGPYADEGVGIAKVTGILTPLGRVLFGVPMVVFGIQHFIFAPFVVTLMSAWIPGRLFWTYFCGVALMAAGAAITVNYVARLAAILLGVMIFLFFVLVHVPLVAGSPADLHQWTYLSQALTFSGIALVVAGVTRPGTWPPPPVVTRSVVLGRWFMAIGLIALGGRQLLQVPFVLGLVPPWYPSQSFWALVSAVFLVATGAGVALKRERVPAMLLSTVLLLFLLFFHLPSLARDPWKGDWGAACKNSILCGGALVLAGARRPTES